MNVSQFFLLLSTVVVIRIASMKLDYIISHLVVLNCTNSMKIFSFIFEYFVVLRYYLRPQISLHEINRIFDDSMHRNLRSLFFYWNCWNRFLLYVPFHIDHDPIESRSMQKSIQEKHKIIRNEIIAKKSSILEILLCIVHGGYLIRLYKSCALHNAIKEFYLYDDLWNINKTFILLVDTFSHLTVFFYSLQCWNSFFCAHT